MTGKASLRLVCWSRLLFPCVQYGYFMEWKWSDVDVDVEYVPAVIGMITIWLAGTNCWLMGDGDDGMLAMAMRGI